MTRKMKDSGIEWIGEIPEDWERTKLKRVLEIPITDGPHETPKLIYNGIPFISAEAIKNNKINFNLKRGYISFEDYEIFSKKCLPKKNDILIIKSGATTGNLAIVETDSRFSIWSPLALIRSNTKLMYFKYLFFYMNSNVFQQQIIQFWNYGTQQNIGMSVLGNLYLAYSNIQVQTRIANYLDNKCSKIDETIQKEKQVIEKLKQYKQSVITEAVTKGLNPNVKMKDSGVEWIGEIPEGWSVKRLRYIGRCQNGISKSSEAFGSGFPFVSYGDVYRNIELPNAVEGLVESSETDRKVYSVEKGDVFFTRTSETIEEIGLVCVCKNTIENATFAGFLIRVRPFDSQIDVNYSKYYFSSNIHRKFFVKEMNLVTRASLSQELLKRLPVLLPNLEEQKQIADYLDKKCASIDKAISNKEKLIEKLTEYKKSLIYECVTGKREV